MVAPRCRGRVLPADQPWAARGRFLLDCQAGEPGFRLEVANLTDQRIYRHVLVAMRLVDSYCPALMNVIYRGTSPVHAVEHSEAEYAAVTSKS